MNIAVIGKEQEFEEFKHKFGTHHQCQRYQNHEFLHEDIEFDTLFDFTISDNPEHFSYYEGSLNKTIFLNTVKMSLVELAVYYAFDEQRIFGFNGLPTFIDRDILEVTSLVENPDKEIFNTLSTAYQLVEDRVGMVTPRIICMIINEAFYTVQEGTATEEDIDLGMKLGTNYPMGPFEWCEKISVTHVYELLEALYNDTKEERYKIAAALRNAYLKSQKITPL